MTTGTDRKFYVRVDRRSVATTEPAEILAWDYRQSGQVSTWLMHIGTKRTVRQLKTMTLPTQEQYWAMKKETP